MEWQVRRLPVKRVRSSAALVFCPWQGVRSAARRSERHAAAATLARKALQRPLPPGSACAPPAPRLWTHLEDALVGQPTLGPTGAAAHQVPQVHLHTQGWGW